MERYTPGVAGPPRCSQESAGPVCAHPAFRRMGAFIFARQQVRLRRGTVTLTLDSRDTPETMKSNRHNKTIGFHDLNDFSRAREVFSTANYSAPGITELLGGEASSAPSAHQVPSLTDDRDARTPLETLISLFYRGAATNVAVTCRALRPMVLDTWVEAGLVEVRNRSVVPTIRIVPHQGLLLACDIPDQSQGPTHPDFVMGIGGSTVSVADATIRRPVRSTLDLGTGCGIQALLAATHSERVVAVDRNKRALDLAVFNARLNGVTNIDFFKGDLFEPVQGHQFDLIVSNPPYVISPEFRAHYRDSGMTGDQFCQKIVRQAPRYLREGGYCQISCNWAHVKGEKWRDRLARWFEGSGCDVWVLRTETRSPSEYVRFWNLEDRREARFAERYRDWMAYYRRRGIEAISTGLITMRRSSGGPNWFRAEDAPKREPGAWGNEFVRRFQSCDFLKATRDERVLLGMRLRLAPDVRFEQQYEPSARGVRLARSRLFRTKGLCYSANVDADTAGVVLRCNGQHHVGELLSSLAARREVAPATLARPCLAVVCRLIEWGFLLPAGPEVPNKERGRPAVALRKRGGGLGRQAPDANPASSTGPVTHLGSTGTS